MADDWYPHNPADFLDGVGTMPLELVGAYIVLLDTMYLLNRPLHDDDAYIAGLLRVSTRKARSVRDQLVDLGKLEAVQGKLDNVRAKLEREKRLNLSRTRAEAGRTGGEKSAQSRKNKDIGKPSASSKTKHIRREEKREDNTGASAPSVVSELSKVLDAEHVAAVTEHRKKIRVPLTPHAAKLLAGKFAKCPDANTAADEMIARGWRGFEAEWLEGKARDGADGGVRRNGTGWLIPHGTEEYAKWRRYALQTNNGDLIYGLPDKAGHVAKMAERWPPRN